MRRLGLTAFALAMTVSAGLCAQEQSGGAVRDPQKMACQRDAQLIYRTGNSTPADVREKMIAARRVYVQDCLTKNHMPTG